MTEETEPILKANLIGILSNKRLPKLEEKPYLVGTFDLLYEDQRVGAVYVSVGDMFDLGDTYHVELKFYPMPFDEYREKMGFRFAPQTEELKPI